MQDNLLVIQAAWATSVVGTVGSWVSALFALRGRVPKRKPLKVRIVYKLAATGAGAGTLIASVEQSPDAGTTWYNWVTAETITLGTTAVKGELFLPLSAGVGTGTEKSIRVKMALTGTTASVQWQAHLVESE